MAGRNRLPAGPLLLALAFGVTTGSVLSPIGNPQNLLIALNGGVSNPFITFLRYLALPTLVNMMAAYFMLKLFYPGYFKNNISPYDADPIKNKQLAFLCQISLGLLVALILLKITLVFIAPHFDFRLTYISLIAVLPVLVASRRRLDIVRRLDWSTLVFFAAMFILMASVWNSGIFQSSMDRLHLDFSGQGVTLGVSVVLSQFISNVPMVALYLPVLDRLGASGITFMALAAGSTIAGNLTILGAASNVIIIQSCENRSDKTSSFWEFFRIGLPLTVINVLVYWVFLRLI
jgi:Na+/H+ antiporter NhaD/arsenite permease-like protein